MSSLVVRAIVVLLAATFSSPVSTFSSPVSISGGRAPNSPSVEEAYLAVSGAVSPPGQQHLTEESVRSLFNRLEHRVQCGGVSCGKCNLSGSVGQLVGNSSSPGGGGAVGGAVAMDLSQFTRLASGCVFYLSAPRQACSALGAGRWAEETELFLDRGCVTPSAIVAEINAPSTGPAQEVERGAAFGRLLYHALIGHCFSRHALPQDGYFLDYIMERMGSQKNFTIRELEALMSSLEIGPSDHEHEDHGEEGHHDDHAGHDHQQGGGRKRKRFGTRDGQEVKVPEAQCFSAEDLLLIHGLRDANSSEPGPMNRSDLAHLSPALVQQILSGACLERVSPPRHDGLSQTERKTQIGVVFQLIIQLCISLAVGSLTGDALLHLFPLFLGLHSHSAGGGGAHEDHGGENLDHVYKILVVMAGIYYFYLMETIFSLEDTEPHHCNHGKVLEMYQKDKTQQNQSISQSDLVPSVTEEKTFPPAKQHPRGKRRSHDPHPHRDSLSRGRPSQHAVLCRVSWLHVVSQWVCGLVEF
ncbi:hypothetical protein NHX12_023454 [Muraenolepis orangiensis]|uniref:Zinc transporter ZIP4 n=1 Tax=Muraenolepis orangiensis TaxID=630683 RepID=A0A9Q0EN55_9TELE|nr:hypothetical protein NHX12_023454 [Muraenolepis orangiensis]